MTSQDRKISLDGSRNLPRGRHVNVRVARFGLVTMFLVWLTSGAAFFASGMWLGTSGSWRSFVERWIDSPADESNFWRTLLLAPDAARTTATLEERLESLSDLDKPLARVFDEQGRVNSNVLGMTFDLGMTLEKCAAAAKEAHEVSIRLERIYEIAATQRAQCQPTMTTDPATATKED